jgi:hypothetical protein
MMDVAPVRATSMRVKPSSFTPAIEKSRRSADGRSAINPKQLHAALQNGMSENEFTAEPLSTMKLDEPPISKLKPNENQVKTVTSRRSSAPDVAVKRSTSMKGYKPGDAAKRNATKRASVMFLDSQFVAVNYGSQTTYEHLETFPEAVTDDQLENVTEANDIPAYRAQRDREPQLPYDLPAEEDLPIGTTRPKILQSDRPNWAQQSQCGDEMRPHLLQVPLLHRRKDDAATKRPALPRRRSSAPDVSSASPAPESVLISTAVKLIKKEERKQRRQSVLDFFKKL